MIKDNIENAKKYYHLNENFKSAFEFLISDKMKQDGKIEITGDDVFVNVQTYFTKSSKDCRFEAHKKYIDIQFMIEGKERIGCADIINTTDKSSYDKEHDVVFLETDEENFIELHKGNFVIFYPTDAHKPCLMIDKPENVRKAVVKIKI